MNYIRATHSTTLPGVKFCSSDHEIRSAQLVLTLKKTSSSNLNTASACYMVVAPDAHAHTQTTGLYLFAVIVPDSLSTRMSSSD